MGKIPNRLGTKISSARRVNVTRNGLFFTQPFIRFSVSRASGDTVASFPGFATLSAVTVAQNESQTPHDGQHSQNSILAGTDADGRLCAEQNL
jgi:hypothetical protein